MNATGRTLSFAILLAVDLLVLSGRRSSLGQEPGPAVMDGIIPAMRRTTWSPGIPGGIPDSAGFPVHSTVALGGDASANRTSIQSAINAAGRSPRRIAPLAPLDGPV